MPPARLAGGMLLGACTTKSRAYLPANSAPPQSTHVDMDLGLQGKLAVVTGSTSGIGKAIAIKLAEGGAHVVINGRSEATTNAAVADIQVAQDSQ